MEKDLAADLLLSVEQRNLVILCGAGLSIPSPSDVPNARALAEHLYDKYQTTTGDTPPCDCQTDLEALAEYVFKKGRQSDFLRVTVPWRQFRGTPNRGHIAIADFLACKAIHSAITTNFDELIEIAARSIIGDRDFRTAFTHAEAIEFRPHNPLLKLHGCVTDRDRTLWCRWQLTPRNPSPINQEIRKRIRDCGVWLRAALAGKDLILVGFWSDWPHIDRVLQVALRFTNPRPARVIVVDVLPEEDLRRKAPGLFLWAKQCNFSHIQQSGHDFLDEFREAISRRFIEELLAASVADYQLETGQTSSPDTKLNSPITTHDLYLIRRDLWGVASDQPVPQPRLRGDQALLPSGVAHLIARNKGATLDGTHYVINVEGKSVRVRVVSGYGREISMVMRNFQKEPPTPVPEDFVICAGARGSGSAKVNFLRDRTKRSQIRGGVGGEWLTLEEARSRGIL